MKYFLLVLFMFIFSSQSFAKNEYYDCDSANVKISDPLIGKSKVYYEKQGEWKLAKGKVTDDKAIIMGWNYTESCDSGELCSIKWIVSRLDIFGAENVVNEAEYTVNSCKKSSGSICKSYKKGDLISTGNCLRLLKK